MIPLDPSKIQSAAPDWQVLVFNEVASTNDVARDLGMQGERGSIAVFAESQTNGRGQRSNRWLTPPGRDLMMSVLLRPAAPMHLWPRITTLAALAVCRAIDSTLPLHCQIKWPNDVYFGDKKVCGLLAETYASCHGNFVVLGVGININTVEFPAELANTATSLRLEAGEKARWIPREPFAAAFLNELDALLAHCIDGFDVALMEVRTRSLLLGKNVRAWVNGSLIHGRAIDLNHEGHLVLERVDGGVEVLTSASEVRTE